MKFTNLTAEAKTYVFSFLNKKEQTNARLINKNSNEIIKLLWADEYHLKNNFIKSLPIYDNDKTQNDAHSALMNGRSPHAKIIIEVKDKELSSSSNYNLLFFRYERDEVGIKTYHLKTLQISIDKMTAEVTLYHCNHLDGSRQHQVKNEDVLPILENLGIDFNQAQQRPSI